MDFWQEHSLEYLEMALKMDFRGRLDKPDGYGKRVGECGDTVEFFIVIDDKAEEIDRKIVKICYDIDGCKNTNACANTVVRMAENLTVAEAWESITPEAVVSYLKTLPSDENHCAELAVGAFYLALKGLYKK
ncbi:putative nitrogen fixation protein NifU (NifU-like protein) [Desulfamplus magnetovallimortis]|uniref:Putative nitrogen fixation protein NifU (NifU-like protein) n=1 Tax=Desulfamplus magnetovallimortis TaxID=1246637 RepID=A0A1W1HE47_9BACT|nr:iron-sulfur cluster assembly scaffold protein [Desulfamplus magnetovallimortis]SLM30740.1 putative nitrogen fixation protein NifU (NifU-like protein) [Desulfamplus magnetovallimortis]